MTSIRSWPSWQKLWFWIAIAGFFSAGAVFSISHGNHEFDRVDGMTEQMILSASDTYVREGFMKYKLLPLCDPFGLDNEGKQRTEPFVYTHYFPGPYWTMGVMKEIFGKDGVRLTRLIPLSVNAGGLAALTLQLATFLTSPVLALLILSAILTSNSVTIFSVGFAGHGYVMGMLFFLFAYILRLANRRTSMDRMRSLAVGAFVGFWMIEYSLDFVPLTFFAAIAFLLYVGRVERKVATALVSGIVAGGVLGMILQITLFAWYLGSFGAVFADFWHFGSWRMGLNEFNKAAPVAVEDLRLGSVLREYNRQAYGATGFTGVNLLILSALFIGMGYFGKARDLAATKRLIGVLACGWLGSAAWNILMRQHSQIHIHFIPRHYFLLFLVFVCIALPIAGELVARSAAFRGRASTPRSA